MAAARCSTVFVRSAAAADEERRRLGPELAAKDRPLCLDAALVTRRIKPLDERADAELVVVREAQPA